MRLQCTLSVCRSELRETSSKLRRKGTRHQPGRFVPGPLYPARPPPPSAPPRPPLTPRAQLPTQAAVRRQPRRHTPHLSTPLSMRLSSPGMARSPAIPPGPPHKPPLRFKLPPPPNGDAPCFASKTQTPHSNPAAKRCLPLPTASRRGRSARAEGGWGGSWEHAHSSRRGRSLPVAGQRRRRVPCRCRAACGAGPSLPPGSAQRGGWV